MKEEIAKSILDCCCTFTGGPWDGMLAIVEDRDNKVTVNRLVAPNKSHPYLHHVYKRVGVTNNFIYSGVESYK